jgi:hypothetical protein
MTLQRAKAMLEQSHVSIAGVIVNGLSEDVRNWSSYGYDAPTLGIPMGAARGLGAEGALESNRQEEDELVLAGSIDA